MKEKNTPKFSFGLSSLSTLKILFFLFIFLSIFTIGSAIVEGNLFSMNSINRVIAQVSGRPAPNSGTIADILKGYEKDDTKVQITDSYDRCRIIDPNLAEPTRVQDSGALNNISLGDNLGGINISPVLDFSDYASTKEYTNAFSKGSELGMSYILAMVTKKDSVDYAIGFINDANQNGFVPVLRLCYPGGCDFDISANADDIVTYFRTVSAGASGDFIAILGPNEPGSGEPQLEMEAFGVKAGDYATLVERAEQAAEALQPQRAGNGGNMYLAPAAFNVTNAIYDDAKEYFKHGLDTSLFDVILVNTYNLAGGEAYSFYQNTALGFPLKATVEEAGLKTVVTEFGTFTETEETGFDTLQENFDKFCSDDTVEGVMFFRSFQSLNLIQPKPRPNLIPDSDIANMDSNCSKGSLREWAWANCNFDSCLYQEDYDSVSTAKTCGVTTSPSRTDQAGAALKLKCNEGGCGIDWQQTIQVSLPIKQFGSNSIAGTQNFNYSPICAELAHMYNTGLDDPLNQFAGELKGDNGLTYPMPWLGSAINCASELILAASENSINYAAEYSPSPGSNYTQTQEEIIKEASGQEYIDLGFTNEGTPAIKLTDENKVIDERTICLNDECLDKARSYSAPIYSPYIPAALSNSYSKPATCSATNLLIRNEANNYIIGPELYYSDKKAEQFFIGSHDLCYQYMIRNSGSSAVDERMAFGPDTKLACGIVDTSTIPDKGLLELGGFDCNGLLNLVNAETGGKKDYHKGKINLSPNLRWCLKYEANPEDEIFYYKADFATPPKFEIPGIYDALYETYKRTQSTMSGRFLKFVVRENVGWEAKVTIKMRDLNSPYDLEPYMYSQQLNSCTVSENMFDNTYKLGRGNPEQTTSQYYDWLGYLDIMQEWNMVYTRDNINTAEKLIPNPLKNDEYADLNIPPELNKDYVWLSGTASQATRFPVLTCDEVALNKLGIGFDDGKAYRLTEDEIYAADFNPTCIDSWGADDYDDELKEFLCEQGYEDMCEVLPPKLICSVKNDQGQEVATPPQTDVDLSDIDRENILIFPVGSDRQIPGCIEPDKSRLVSVNTDRPVFADGSVNVGNADFKLLAEPAAALERMMNDMRNENPEAYNTCGFNWAYRSSELQASFGTCGTGTGTACACHNEHQLGSVIDFRPANGLGVGSFANTACFTWVNENAKDYGFVRSYYPGNPDGYSSEPWHWRWLPDNLAQTFEDKKDSYQGHLKLFLEDVFFNEQNEEEETITISSSQVTCPLVSGRCIQGPYNPGTPEHRSSHTSLNSIDIFTSQRDADGNLILYAPFDGKIVDVRTDSYCLDGSRAGIGIYFQGKVNGELVTLFIYHLRSNLLVDINQGVYAKQPIAQLAEASDPNIDSLACLSGVDGTPHLHIEFAEKRDGKYRNLSDEEAPFDLRAFFYSGLGCNPGSGPACSTNETLNLNTNQLVCEYEETDDSIPMGNGPDVCNEFNCFSGSPEQNKFENSLLCAAQTLSSDIKAGKTLAELIDEYGPYCHNETFGALDSGISRMPFAHNFFNYIYDPYAIVKRSCNAIPPQTPRQKDIDKYNELAQQSGTVEMCRSVFGRTIGNLKADQEAWDYYRGAIESCGLTSVQMTWDGGTNGLNVDQVLEKMVREVNYAGFSLNNVPEEKLRVVLKTADKYDINPYLLVGMWGTESWFGQSNPVCNVY